MLLILFLGRLFPGKWYDKNSLRIQTNYLKTSKHWKWRNNDSNNNDKNNNNNSNNENNHNNNEDNENQNWLSSKNIKTLKQ